MGKFLYTLTDNQPLSPTTQLITLKKVDPAPFSFQAGQYAGIAFARGFRYSPTRCFSIASTPDNPEVIQFGIRVGGKYTQKVTTLSAGTPFTVYGPYGEFTLEGQGERPQILIAGGIGITPFISMIRAALSRTPRTPLILLYSNKTRSDIPFLDELRQLKAANPNFYYLIALTQDTTIDPKDRDMVLGRLDQAAIKRMAPYAPNVPRYLLCGPPLFMGALVETLSSMGVADESIVLEAFSQVPGAQKSPSLWPKIIYSTATAGFVLFGINIASADLAKHSITANNTSLPSVAQNQPVATATPTPSPTPTPTDTPTPTGGASNYATPYPTYTPTPTPVPVYQPIYQPRSSVS